MASFIPGYKCDIFISCRPKDIKIDNRVTEFAGNLKKEFDATFKQNIGVLITYR
jgi:hypothetical protein